MTELKSKRDALEGACEFLNLRDQTFASSLIQFYDQRKTWSEKQFYWVDTLIKRAADNQPKEIQQTLDFETQGAPGPTLNEFVKDPKVTVAPPVPEPVENLIEISRLFERAIAQGLKYPKIRLEAEDGTKVILRYAGPTSRNVGGVNITDQAPYHAGRAYFGSIDLKGKFIKSRMATPAILKLLNQLAKDPVGLAKLYGLKTSTCCFCSRPLETSKSVTMGYGPICAEKFGLPWGEVVESTYTCLTPEDTNASSNASGQ